MLPVALRRAVAGLALAAAAIGALELGLRALVPEDALLFVHEEGRAPLRLPRTPPPGAVRVEEDGPYRWTCVAEAGGLRERDTPALGAAPDEARLVLVGDSWAWGYGLDQADTLDAQLEGLLAGRLAPTVQVINAGVPGGSDRAVLDRAQRLLAALPDVRGVILAQPHNPRHLPGQPRAGPPPQPSPWWTYRLLRVTLLPRLDPTPPRALHGEALAAATADWSAFAEAQRAAGRGVWFLALPQDRESAVDRGHPPEREWLEAMAAVPTVGHALDERACWAFTDPFHPSPAGARALAEVLAPVILGGPAPPPWSTAPRCADVAGAGPGKPGWEWTDEAPGLPSPSP